MKYEKKVIFSIFYIVLGTVLLGLGIFDIVDSFWSGMGGALVAVGIIQTVRQVKYRKNEEYREKVETEIHDERNKFISGRAWAWSGYSFVMLNSIGTIIFRVFGKEELSQLCAFSVCIILVIYWICYLVLRKKY